MEGGFMLLFVIFIMLPATLYAVGLVVAFVIPQLRPVGWLAVTAGLGALLAWKFALGLILSAPVVLWIAIIVHLVRRRRA